MNCKPPYLGAAYYPEDWPPEEVGREIARMKEAGMNVMRIGEFAWSRMEPTEGHYDLGWLHNVVEKLAKADIATVMCTPTCTPPQWLSAKYPSILKMAPTGQRFDAGHRLYACPNSPVYRKLCAKIVTKLAKEFGRDERVIGWQIDNEVSGECFCPVCVEKFRAWVRSRFGTVAKLNEAWGNGVWSHDYTDWDQLPFPQAISRYDPPLRAAWFEFASNSYVEYVAHQAAILHCHASQLVGTDMMPIVGIDYDDMLKSLDVAQYNHYNTSGNLWETAFWFDFCRQHKARPFWNTETSTCWSGCFGGGVQKPGFCVANSWLPIAMGAEANLYWLWRQHASGREIYHGAVLSTAGRPLHIFSEVQEVARGLRASEEFLNGTRPAPAGMAMHFSHRTGWIRECQWVINEKYGSFLRERFYRPLVRAQWRMDVVQPAKDLSAYKVALSPYLAALDEAELRERLKAWIEAGGIWICGPSSDDQTLHATKFRDSHYGSLEEWGGVGSRWQLPGFAHGEPLRYAMRLAGGKTTRGDLWYDGFELRGAEALATYSEGPLKGLAAVTRKRMGKGVVVALGTALEPAYLQELVGKLAAEAGLAPAARAAQNVMAIPREGKAGKGLIVVEVESKPGTVRLARPATDLITGKRHTGLVKIAPHGVMVLKYGNK